MKKTLFFIAILSVGMLFSCKEDSQGGGPTLRLSPKSLDFGNKRDTAIVTAQRAYFSIGGKPITQGGYISNSEDTLYDGWIKVITLSDQMQIKVIVADNDTGDGRFYRASIYGRNNGDDINIFQSAK